MVKQLAQLLSVCFLILLPFLSGVVEAHPQGLRKRIPETAETLTWTNAARLAHGLTPRKPKAFYSPTRVVRNVASPVPNPTYLGNIAVYRKSDDTLVGWVSSTLQSSGRLDVTTSTTPSDRLLITFTDPGSPFDIKGVNVGPGEPAHIGFLGAPVTNTNGNPRVDMVLSNTTPVGSTPTSVGNSSGGGQTQTAVWSYNSILGRLIPQLITPSGENAAESVLLYSSSGSNAGLYSGFNPSPPSGFTDVYFVFESAI